MKLFEEFKLVENLWEAAADSDNTMNSGITNIRCIHALYEDADGCICNVSVHSNGLSEEEIEELLYEKGMSGVIVWDEHDIEVDAKHAANYKPGDVVETYDVSNEDIEDVAAITGKDPKSYKDYKVDIKGIKVITIWDGDESDKQVLEFATFEEAAKHFDHVYVNAVEETYAEEVLYPVLDAMNNEEYDYIDDNGYAVYEQRVSTSVFESCNSKGLKESMKLHEEFKLFENMWDESLQEAAKKLLWKNPDGIEIDLNDPVAFQQELDDEKKRYQAKLSQQLTKFRKNQIGSMQDFSRRAMRRGTTVADEINREINIHLSFYKKDLEKTKYLLDPNGANTPTTKTPLQKVEYNHKKFDLTNETELLDYVTVRVFDHMGKATPDKAIRRLHDIKKELAPMLAGNGYNDLAKKLIVNIDQQIQTIENTYGNNLAVEVDQDQLSFFESLLKESKLAAEAGLEWDLAELEALNKNGSSNELNETYDSNYGEEFCSLTGAMYVACEIVASCVDDEPSADALLSWADSYGLDGAELAALETLITDALENAGAYTAAFGYHKGTFPVSLAYKITANDRTAMDALIASCDDDSQKKELLAAAINKLVLEGITD